MFEFEGKHFIVSIGAILLLLGAIIFYFQNRVGALEKAIGKQNQVLSSFIANVQGELRGAVAAPTTGGYAVDTSSPPERCDVPDDKIEVSSDDYDSDSDSDSSNTSSDEETVLKIGREEPDVKVIEMLNESTDLTEYQENTVSVTEVLLQDMVSGDVTEEICDIVADTLSYDDVDEDGDDDDDDDDDDDEDDEDDDDDDDGQTDSVLSSHSAENMNVKKLISVELDAPVDYNSEKKNVLIQLCNEKGLGDESTLKRYKKQELVNLLSSV
jgi:hypothetical protein